VIILPFVFGLTIHAWQEAVLILARWKNVIAISKILMTVPIVIGQELRCNVRRNPKRFLLA
jgi:hypothetical protein